jgi:D-serine deaminase-like pyridoxal phosphate-dependent protein
MNAKELRSKASEIEQSNPNLAALYLAQAERDENEEKERSEAACKHKHFSRPEITGGLNHWIDTCDDCSAIRESWYGNYGISSGDWK